MSSISSTSHYSRNLRRNSGIRWSRTASTNSFVNSSDER